MTLQTELAWPTKGSMQNPTHIKAGDRARIGNEWRRYQFGSVVSYCLSAGLDPVDKVLEHVKLGHDLRWASIMPTVISPSFDDNEVDHQLKFGEFLMFEGALVQPVKGKYGNVDLEPVETETNARQVSQ